MIYAQIAIAILLLVNFLVLLRSDFYGRKAREPGGFGGAIITLLVTAAAFLLYWKAGAFSLFIG